MFQFIGELVGTELCIFFGWACYFKPYHIAGCEGSQSEIGKNIRFIKRIGILLMVCGSIMLVGVVIGFIRQL